MALDGVGGRAHGRAGCSGGWRHAAALHGLSDDRALPVEVLVTFGRHLTDRQWVSFPQERDGVRGVSTGAEPPRTRVEDTVLDLCADSTDAQCVAWITVAVQRRLTTVQQMVGAMNRRTRLPHRRLIQDLLGDVANGVHSPLEHRYLIDVERAHGLPPASRQHRSPGRNVFVDVAYLQFAVLVELDGRVGHTGDGAWRDRGPDNAHAHQGSVTLRFGWSEISDEPCAVALQVGEVLVNRGWGGYPSKCDRCR